MDPPDVCNRKPNCRKLERAVGKIVNMKNFKSDRSFEFNDLPCINNKLKKFSNKKFFNITIFPTTFSNLPSLGYPKPMCIVQFELPLSLIYYECNTLQSARNNIAALCTADIYKSATLFNTYPYISATPLYILLLRHKSAAFLYVPIEIPFVFYTKELHCNQFQVLHYYLPQLPTPLSVIV